MTSPGTGKLAESVGFVFCSLAPELPLCRGFHDSSKLLVPSDFCVLWVVLERVYTIKTFFNSQEICEKSLRGLLEKS